MDLAQTAQKTRQTNQPADGSKGGQTPLHVRKRIAHSCMTFVQSVIPHLLPAPPFGIRRNKDSSKGPSRIDPILSSAMEHTLSSLLSQTPPNSSSHLPPLRVAQLEGCFAGKVCDELLRTSEGIFDLSRFNALIGSFRDAISDACYGSASGAERCGGDDASQGEGAVMLWMVDVLAREWGGVEGVGGEEEERGDGEGWKEGERGGEREGRRRREGWGGEKR